MCHWDFSTIMKLICNWNTLCCHKREQKHPRLVDWRCYLIVSVIYRQMLVVIACLAKFAYRNDIMFQWYYGLVLTFRRVDWDSFHYVWKWLSSNPMLTILFYYSSVSFWVGIWWESIKQHYNLQIKWPLPHHS